MQIHGRRILLPGLIVLPAALYVLGVLYLAVDIPRWDDYKVFFDYLNRSGEARLDFLFIPHAEHRIVFTRLVAEGMFQLLGRIDFRYLVYIGNLALLLVFLVLFRRFERTGLPIRLFLPVPYLLFLIPLGENTAWATGSIQNFSVLLFALLSLVFFEKTRPACFFLSMVFAIAAAFTSGSGLLVFVALLLWSMLDLFDRRASEEETQEPLRGSKRWRIIRTILIVGVAGAVFHAYFEGYVRPQDPGIPGPFADPIRSLSYFVVFLGSTLQTVVPAFIAGVVILFLFVRLSLEKYSQQNPVAYWFLAFLIMNGAAAAFARAGFGVHQALSSRYVVVSVLILIQLYVALLETTDLSRIAVERARRAFLAVVLLASALSLLLQGPILVGKRSELRLGMARWRATGVGLAYPKQERAAALLRLASKKGYYQPPDSRPLR